VDAPRPAREDNMQRNPHSHRAFGRAALVVLVIGSTLAVALSTSAGAATASGTSAVSGKSSKGQGHLSPRLRALTKPEVQTASTEARAAALSVAERGPGSLLSHSPGRVLVDIRFDLITASRLDPVKATGAKFIAANGPTRTATFDVAFDSIASLENLPGVRWIEEVLTPLVHGAGGGAATDPGVVTNSTCPQGIAVSEADTQLLASTARTTYGVNGAGVRIGVLSDSFAKRAAPVTTFAQDVDNGDLPGAANTCGFTTPVTVQADAPGTGSDEGRAMAQLAHDVAPGSPLTFATAFNGIADFANQIRNLQINGSKVIVDDITYFAEPMYQDGVIAKAAQDVTDLGSVFFSSAANNNVIVGGQNVGSYEATGGYRSTACPAVLTAPPYSDTDCHDFDPGAGADNGNLLTMNNGASIRMVLGYNEPQFGITTDLDIFLIDSVTGGVVAVSNTDNISSDSTFEMITYTNNTGGARSFRLHVARFSGATPRFKTVMLSGGGTPVTAVQWNTSQLGDVVGPTTFGHNAKINGAAVAAVPYNNSNVAESFTSRGPATYCWGPVDGVVPAAALPVCLTKQIDFAATDGAANSFFGQNVAGTWRFYGTSAAAPHAAAVAALMLEAQPCATPAEVLAALAASGRTVGSFGVADVGTGLIDAVDAIDNLADCPPTFPAVTPIVANEGNIVTVNFPGAESVPAGHALTYSFTQDSGPAVTYIENTSTTTRRFIAPRTTANAPMPLTFTATVTDSTTGASTDQTVEVTVNNITPSASIVAPPIVTAGSSVVLKGASVDQIEPDIAPSGTTGRQYTWAQTGGPAVTLTPGTGAGFRQATFTPPSAGTYTFSLVVTDHGGTGAASPPANVTITARSAPAAGTLNGVVTDETGAALVGATVDVFTNVAGSPVATTTSGAGGVWTVGSLSAGTRYYVRFTSAGRGTRWNFDGFNTFFVRPVMTPNAIVDAMLTSTGSLRSITGTVQNSALAGVSGIKVRLLDHTGLLSQTTTVAGGGYSFTGLTAKGTYRIEIAQGDATFATAWVTSDGRGSMTGATGSPTLLVSTIAGNAVATTTVIFNKNTELRTLTVTVRDTLLNPITGVEVRVYNPGWAVSQRTNVNGVYTIASLRPGALYQVWVWTKCAGCGSTGFTSQWANAVPGEQYDQSGKLANFVDITGNQSLTFTLS